MDLQRQTRWFWFYALCLAASAFGLGSSVTAAVRSEDYLTGITSGFLIVPFSLCTGIYLRRLVWEAR